MLRTVSLVVAVVLVVAFVWPWGEREDTPAGARAVAPDAPRADAPAREGKEERATICDADSVPESRVALAPAATAAAPKSPAETPSASAHLALLTQPGRLDDAVPRPVRGGRVWFHPLLGVPGTEPSLERIFEAAVREDGTFELELPRGHGQILAVCPGWVSQRTPFDSIEGLALRLGRQPTFGEIEQVVQEELGLEPLEAQRIDVPARAPLVVAMERAGTLEVAVRTADGAPVARALVTASPDVHWIGAGSTPHPGRAWSAVTDAQGRARIEDLPADDALRVVAEHATFRMRREDRDRVPSVALASGRTTALEIVLEPAQD